MTTDPTLTSTFVHMFHQLLFAVKLKTTKITSITGIQVIQSTVKIYSIISSDNKVGILLVMLSNSVDLTLLLELIKLDLLGEI